MPANYNNAALFYDQLAAVVFGDALNRAQQSLLHHIPQNAKILIVGGGTGKILEQLSQLYPSDLGITYVEISEKMTAIARKRKTGKNAIEFIIAPVEEIALAKDYDVVITPFLLDNFGGDALNKLYDHLNKALSPKGIWINTDFQLTGKWWQGLLLKTMLLFFKLLCGVESKGLSNIPAMFQAAGYCVFDTTAFYGDFIGSTLYRRNNN